MKAESPVITTAKSRVFLRRPVKADISTVYELARDPDVVRHTFVPYPYQRKHAELFIRIAADAFKKKTSYIFVVIEKESGQLIGALGLHQISPIHRRAELGYWMGKPYRGKGYMSEAVELLLAFGFRKVKLERIFAYAMTINPASSRVLKKCGFRDEGLLHRHIKRQGKWRDLYAYGILKSDWKRR